jgi:hypothetical protein
LKKVNLILFALFLFLGITIAACHTQKKNASGGNDQQTNSQAAATDSKNSWRNQLLNSKSESQRAALEKLRNGINRKSELMIDSLQLVELKQQSQKNN